ncbi:hypothetical protein LCGC14_2859120 [marine sediment metagenome]|uniref:DoxX family protein n=1 Tax=marine sediment metagenome TaxID=412755 RepID=A0A0F8Y659_9ZZZZ
MIIKRILQTEFNQDTKDFWILLLRLLVAAFMLTHGISKFNSLIAEGEIKFGDPIGIGPVASLVLAVFAQVFCSILVGIGLGTRYATIPLIITMAVAGFITLGADPFGRKELALLYLLTYVTLFFLGGGKYSVDYLISRKRSGK